VRFWPYKKYPYLIFHVEKADHIEVWPLLHAHRDVPRRLQTSHSSEPPAG
jgi:toxin ParE1/3/4